MKLKNQNKKNITSNLSKLKQKKKQKSMQKENESKESNKLATLSLIFAFLLPPIGVVLAIIALIQIHNKKQKGLILALIALILGPTLTIAFIVSIAAILLVRIFGIS